MNHSKAGHVMPNVNARTSLKNLAKGNDVDDLRPGSRCSVMASERPLRRDLVVYLVVARRYRRCNGNIIEKDECTR